MPAPSAIPADSDGHHWHMRFDRVLCRNCGADHEFPDDHVSCTGAKRIRPLAAFRQLQQTEGRA